MLGVCPILYLPLTVFARYMVDTGVWNIADASSVQSVLLRMSPNHVEHAAMRDDDHVAIYVSRSQTIHNLHHPVMKNLCTLGAFYRYLRIKCQPLRPCFWILVFDFLRSQAFKNPVALLL